MNKARRLFTPEALVLIVLAVVLTMISGSLMVWHDEAITLLEIAGNPVGGWTGAEQTLGEMAESFQGTTSPGDLARSLIDTDVHPPIYYWVALGFAEVFGNTIYSARLVSVLSVIAAAWMILDLAKRFAPAGRWIVWPMLIFSPTLIYAGTNGRPYGLALLLVTVMIWALMQAISANARGDQRRVAMLVILSSIAGGLGFLTHYFTILVAGPVFVVATVLLIKRHAIPFVCSYLILLAALIGAYPFLVEQLDARPDQYAGFNGFVVEGLALASSAASQFGQADPTSAVFLLMTIAFTAVLGMAFLRLIFRDKNSHTTLVLVSSSGPLIGLIILFWMTDKTLAVEGARYATFAFPGIALMLARYLHQKDSDDDRGAHFSRVVIATSIFVLAIFPLVLNKGLSGMPWSDHRTSELTISAVESSGAAKSGVIMAGLARGRVGSLVANLDPNLKVLSISETTIEPDIRDFTRELNVVVVNTQNKGLADRDKLIFALLLESGFNPTLGGKLWKR